MTSYNITIIDIGEMVLCDLCNADYTDSEAEGGILMGTYSIEFIPIKSWVARGSGAPGNGAGHNRVPSRDRGRPPSTGGSGLSPCDNA
jgi:hypothetical protein